MKPIETLSDEELARLVQRAIALPDAPAALVRAAIDLWPAAPPALAPTPAPSPQPAAPPEPAARAVQAAWRRVVASLGFDSWATPAGALAVRALPAETRHLLFTARGRDIDVRISPDADRFSISGQVLGPDTAGSIELVTQPDGGPGAVQAVALDALGEFRLDGVPGGTYRMTLRAGGDEIALPAIVVGPRPR